ncbi:MAG: glycine-rich protein [Firmicutes bacterium]|nr:glycine-rich protein [Bacillota bacterium]
MTKKHKTGFTLVELLSVIVLLGIISVIIIPNFTGILKSSKEDLYNNQIEVIKTSAKLWTLNEDNKIVLSENTSWPYLITLGDLQDSGLLDELKNPKDDTYFSDSTLIYISVTDGTYTFTVDEDSINASSNVITLNDERSYKVEINTSFTEPGYSASINGNDITSNVERKIYKNGVEVSSIDTTKISNYTIQYKVSYEGENGITERSIAIRRVKIVDTIPPVLVCSSCNGTIELESNNTDSYEFPTVTATDNSLEDIKVIKMGSFSSIIPGQKKIIYIATDSSGNTGRLEILINVKDTIAPVISDIAQSMDDSGSDTIFSYAVVATDSGSGIKEYSFDGGNTWQKSNKAKFVYSDDTTRTIMVKDNSGNVSSRQIAEFISKEYVFDYTGEQQIFTAPLDGYYKLETWGAQGGTVTSYRGGYGGYSSGTVALKKGDKLYVNVGGAGQGGAVSTNYTGGYNGGGATNGTGADHYHASGGGATHIAKVSGQLASIGVSKLDQVLIVAGGGGGAYIHNAGTGYASIGGSGGGYIGTAATTSGSNGKQGLGGSQTAGGRYTSSTETTSTIFGSFGKGGTPSASWGSAGGGGYYGGGASYGSTSSNGNSGGGGGSGYIGNSLLTDKVMYCYSCTASTGAATKTISTTNVSATATSNYAKSGNGYAIIKYLGK